MSLKKYIALFITFSSILFCSCQKENIDFFLPDGRGIDTAWVTHVDATMAVSLLQSDLVKPVATDNAIFGAIPLEKMTGSGMRLFFPGNCITDYNSQLVEGNINIQSMLLQKKGDWIRMNKPTMSNGSVLASAGMLLIDLEKNDSLLKLSSGSKLNIQYRESLQVPKLSLFYGTDSSFAAGGWDANTDQSNNIRPANEGYEINTKKLGWINTGYSIDTINSTKTMIDLVLEKQFTNSNTEAWLVLKHYNSIIDFKANIERKKFVALNIPADMEATVVVISKQVDDYYMATKLITTNGDSNNSLTVDMKPTKTSFGAVLQYLDSL